MLVLIGPSASGKTEISQILINKYQMTRMITYTTRPMRKGEVNGVSYHFVTKQEFLELLANDEFVESVCYNDNYYGTRKKDVKEDKIVILEPNGFLAFKEKMPNSIVSFYLNASTETRKKRMENRKDKPEDIEKRIIEDDKAFAFDYSLCDYQITNENELLENVADQIYKLYKKKINKEK